MIVYFQIKLHRLKFLILSDLKKLPTEDHWNKLPLVAHSVSYVIL